MGNHFFVSSSAGKNDSIRSSCVVKSSGVPSVVIVVKKLAFIEFFSKVKFITGQKANAFCI